MKPSAVATTEGFNRRRKKCILGIARYTTPRFPGDVVF
jgi:hypothetical protein